MSSFEGKKDGTRSFPVFILVAQVSVQENGVLISRLYGSMKKELLEKKLASLKSNSKPVHENATKTKNGWFVTRLKKEIPFECFITE